EGVEVISTDLFNLIPWMAAQWRDATFVDLKGLAFDHLIVTNGPAVFELERDPTNKLWRLAPNKPMSARADSPKIEELLLKLRGLRVSHFETDDPKADLDSFGLQPPEL